MQFIGDYLALQIEAKALAQAIARSPFAMASDMEDAKALSQRLDKIIQQGLEPFLKGVNQEIDSYDATFLYRCEDLRVQLLFQYGMFKIIKDIKGRQESHGVKVSDAPTRSTMAALDGTLRRNDAVVSIARNQRLMKILKELSPILAQDLTRLAEETQSLPSFINNDEQGFYNGLLRPYRHMRLEITPELQAASRTKSKLMMYAREYAGQASADLYKILDAAHKRGQSAKTGHPPPDNDPI